MTVPTFRLPIQAVIEAAKGFPELVALQAQVISRSRSKEAYSVQVVGGAGFLHALTMTTSTGSIYAQGEKVFTFLQETGDLEWHLLPLPGRSNALQERSSSPLERSPFSREMIRPVCLIPLTPALVQHLPFHERHVLMVINKSPQEQKTLGEIAQSLGKKPEQIYQHLMALKKKRLIDFESIGSNT